MPLSMRLAGVWGGDAGRLPAALETLALSGDPARVYALGNLDGRGVLRVIDARTGLTEREHVLPELVLDDGRAVVSRASGGEALVAFDDGDGSAVHALSLGDGTTRPVSRASWRVESLAFTDDARVLIDGALVEPGAAAVERPGSRRWPSRDLTRLVREEIESAATVRVLLRGAPGGREQLLAERQRSASLAALSDDGRTLWRLCRPSGADDSTVLERWDVARRARVMTRRLSRGDRLVATRVDGGDELVCGRDEGFGRPLEAIVRHGVAWRPEDACASPDGLRAAYVRRGVLHAADLSTGREAALSDGHAGEVRSIAISRGGVAVVGGADGDITVWRLARGELAWRLEGGGAVRQVATSPDGRLAYALVASEIDGATGTALRAWDLAEGVEVTPSSMTFSPTARLALSPDGARAVVTSEPGGLAPAWVDLAAWRDRSYARSELFASRRVVDETEIDSAASFDEDGGARLVVRGPGGDAWCLTLDPVTGAVRGRDAAQVFPRHLRAAYGAVFAEVRPQPGAGASVRRYPMPGGATLPPCSVPPGGSVKAVALGARGLAAGTDAGDVHLFDGTSPAPVAWTRDSDRAITALALSPDGRALLAGTADGRVFVYALDSLG